MRGSRRDSRPRLRSCGTELRPAARFCDGCGAAAAPAPARDPRDYTPKHLAEKILGTGKSRLCFELRERARARGIGRL